MNCRDCESWLAAKADGSIEEDRRRLLDAHLLACDRCRRALADQVQVREALAATPLVSPRGDFAARINVRIDESEGWLGLADFRAWTLRLAPVAAALALLAMLWRSTPPSSTSASTAASATFSPTSISDWDRDVSPNALLEAALRHVPGDADAR